MKRMRRLPPRHLAPIGARIRADEAAPRAHHPRSDRGNFNSIGEVIDVKHGLVMASPAEAPRGDGTDAIRAHVVERHRWADRSGHLASLQA